MLQETSGVLSPIKSTNVNELTVSDLDLLDSTTEKKLTDEEVSVQVEYPERKPAAKKPVVESVFEPKSSSPEGSTSSSKRSIAESQSTDTETTLDSQSKKLKPKK